MGYTRSALRLEWDEDSEFSGLVVRMKRISIKQLVHIESLRDLRDSGTNEEALAAWGELLDAIAKGLLGWNLEDEVIVQPLTLAEGATAITEKVAVPATREALDDQDIDLILALVKAWAKAAAGVPLASPPSSPTGEPAPPDEEWASYLGTSQEVLPAPVLS